MRTIGPRRITKVRQVAVPARLMAEVGLDIGSEVYFALSEGEPRRLMVIPAEDVEAVAGRLAR